MNPFAHFNLDLLPESATPVLDKTRAAFGFVPNLAAVMAQSPVSLNGYLNNLQTFGESSFAPAHQQLVLLCSSVASEVAYAVAVHTILARGAGLDETVIQAIRNRQPLADQNLEALRELTESAASNGGKIDDDKLVNYLSAGWSKRQIIEIFFALAAKEFVYRVQRLAEVPLDEPLASGRWETGGVRQPF